jgi:hypothetical protein
VWKLWTIWLKRYSTLQALLVSERQSTVADEEKPNLKTDDANFPWGIGGTDYRLFEIPDNQAIP